MTDDKIEPEKRESTMDDMRKEMRSGRCLPAGAELVSSRSDKIGAGKLRAVAPLFEAYANALPHVYDMVRSSTHPGEAPLKRLALNNEPGIFDMNPAPPMRTFDTGVCDSEHADADLTKSVEAFIRSIVPKTHTADGMFMTYTACLILHPSYGSTRDSDNNAMRSAFLDAMRIG